jgi:hypothetical protein
MYCHIDKIKMTDTRTKIPRSVSIDRDVYDRIESMCARLGVNVNAYLLNAIGEKIYKDESMLRMEQMTAQATSDSMEKLMGVLSEQLKE